MLESGLIEMKQVDPYIDDILAEYASNSDHGSDLISTCLTLYIEWDKKSSTAIKAKKARDLIRKALDHVLLNSEKVFAHPALNDLSKHDPKLKQDIEILAKSSKK